jgi:DNA-binding protein HU-beta
MQKEKKMNKKNLINHVALEENLTKTNARDVIEVAFDGIVWSLETYGHITIRNFGSFKLVKRAARKGRNPQTGEELEIPETTVVKFTPAKELKEEVKTKDV